MPEGAVPTLFTLSTEAIGVWVAVLLTLAIFSFLYRDNPIYKLAEHIFVGISAGYGVVIVWHEAVIPILVNPLLHPEAVGLEAPNYWVLIPGALGLLMLTRFFRRWDWLSRWPIAFIMGLFAGAAIPVTIQMNFIEQMRGTMLPVWPSADVTSWIAFSNLLIVVGVLCTLAYFYFSREHKGALGVASRVGIYFLMVAFGAGFGNTVMARISLLIGRVQFLYFDWWQALVMPSRHPLLLLAEGPVTRERLRLGRRRRGFSRHAVRGYQSRASSKGKVGKRVSSTPISRAFTCGSMCVWLCRYPSNGVSRPSTKRLMTSSGLCRTMSPARGSGSRGRIEPSAISRPARRRSPRMMIRPAHWAHLPSDSRLSSSGRISAKSCPRSRTPNICTPSDSLRE